MGLIFAAVVDVNQLKERLPCAPFFPLFRIYILWLCCMFYTKSGFIFARFFGKCKQVFVRNFELDDFLEELDKFFQ